MYFKIKENGISSKMLKDLFLIQIISYWIRIEKKHYSMHVSKNCRTKFEWIATASTDGRISIKFFSFFKKYKRPSLLWVTSEKRHIYFQIILLRFNYGWNLAQLVIFYLQTTGWQIWVRQKWLRYRNFAVIAFPLIFFLQKCDERYGHLFRFSRLYYFALSVHFHQIIDSISLTLRTFEYIYSYINIATFIQHECLSHLLQLVPLNFRRQSTSKFLSFTHDERR